MKTLWVFDDFGRGISQLDLVMLLASSKLWSIHCPQHTRVLHTTKVLGNLIKSLGIPDVFDEIVSLSNFNSFNVDTKVFWAYPKLRVLLAQTEPVFLVDHDFLVFSPLASALDLSKPCYNYTEDARNYYPNSLDSVVKQISYKTRWPSYSANVSFLYLPDPDWTRFYAGTSLQIMEELSGKATNSKYLIFAEQMVLKHLLGDLDYQCLLKNIYKCKTESWSEDLDSHGLWTWENALWKRFIHYGPVKRRWNKKTYDSEMSWICEVAGIDQDILKKTNYLRK